VKCEKKFKFVFIEVRLASMMREPSPCALRLVLWEPMRLSAQARFLKLSCDQEYYSGSLM